jgi:uncharacterized protein YndB with AHSA1/START domain
MMSTTRIDRGSTDTTTIYSEGGDLVYERVFDAPRELVWRAHTDPELIPLWWGPRRYRTRVEMMDVRVGGKWRFVNVGEDGGEHAFYGEYLEVDPPSRMTWTFMFDVEGVGPQGGPETLTLESLDDGRTLLRAMSHMGSPEAIEAALATGMSQGAIETWDRLDELLASRRSG